MKKMLSIMKAVLCQGCMSFPIRCRFLKVAS